MCDCRYINVRVCIICTSHFLDWDFSCWFCALVLLQVQLSYGNWPTSSLITSAIRHFICWVVAAAATSYLKFIGVDFQNSALVTKKAGRHFLEAKALCLSVCVCFRVSHREKGRSYSIPIVYWGKEDQNHVRGGVVLVCCLQHLHLWVCCASSARHRSFWRWFTLSLN